MHNNVTILIDGFNLYHSVKDASTQLGFHGKGTKWLNIKAICEAFIPSLPKDSNLNEILYFSALADHITPYYPDVTERHKLFIRCIEDTGVTVHLSRFKAKDIKCPHCSANIRRYEEKETDVAIASKLIELSVMKTCEIILVMTGDTDIIPAIKSAKRLSPRLKIGFIFPFKRKSKELAQLADYSFKLKPKTYQAYQFPTKVELSDGTILNKPDSW